MPRKHKARLIVAEMGKVWGNETDQVQFHSELFEVHAYARREFDRQRPDHFRLFRQPFIEVFFLLRVHDLSPVALPDASTRQGVFFSDQPSIRPIRSQLKRCFVLEFYLDFLRRRELALIVRQNAQIL